MKSRNVKYYNEKWPQPMKDMWHKWQRAILSVSFLTSYLSRRCTLEEYPGIVDQLVAERLERDASRKALVNLICEWEG